MSCACGSNGFTRPKVLVNTKHDQFSGTIGALCILFYMQLKKTIPIYPNNDFGSFKKTNVSQLSIFYSEVGQEPL